VLQVVIHDANILSGGKAQACRDGVILTVILSKVDSGDISMIAGQLLNFLLTAVTAVIINKYQFIITIFHGIFSLTAQFKHYLFTVVYRDNNADFFRDCL
jgi:hypothetical protein